MYRKELTPGQPSFVIGDVIRDSREQFGFEPSTEHLNTDQEQHLATLIQAGLASATDLASGRKMRSATRERLEAEAALGIKARDALVLTNLKLIGYVVSHSMGWHAGEAKDPGKYRPLAASKSPHASFEDRWQVGTIALLRLAENFQPGYIGRNKKVTTLAELAIWNLQNYIDKNSDTVEWNGARVPSLVMNKIRSAYNNERSLPVELDEDLTKYDLVRTAFCLDEVVTHKPDETIEADIELPVELALEDVIADPNGSVHMQVEINLLRESIDKLLLDLTDRESTVIKMRFGLVNGEYSTLDEVGREFGLTRERIRQIENRTMTKLRLKSRQIQFRGLDLLDIEEEQKPNTAGDAYQLGRRVLKKYSLAAAEEVVFEQGDQAQVGIEQTPVSLELESWQSFADEPWELPDKSSEIEKLLERRQDRLAEVKNLFTDTRAYQFNSDFVERVKTPYPVHLLELMRASYGDETYDQQDAQAIAQHFIDNVLPRYREALGEKLSTERVGEFLSRLIQLGLREASSEITLTIPDNSTLIDRLGNNLTKGSLTVNGPVGHRFASGVKGTAVVTLNGSAGSSVASDARGNAYIQINGDVENTIGERLRGDAIIEFNSKDIWYLPVIGKDMSGRAKILVQLPERTFTVTAKDDYAARDIEMVTRELYIKRNRAKVAHFRTGKILRRYKNYPKS